jgi:hypothetical protein
MKTSFFPFADPPRWDPAMFHPKEDEQRGFLLTLLYAFTEEDKNRLNFVKFLRETGRAFLEDKPDGEPDAVRKIASSDPHNQG